MVTREAAAEYISEGILGKISFIEVKLMSIRDNEVDLAFLKQSDAGDHWNPGVCVRNELGVEKVV